MEFAWSEDEARFRRELVAFLDDALPPEWEEISKDGPGGDGQPIIAQRGPGPLTTAKSISSTDASSLAIMCKASRQIASCNLVATKPGISRFNTSGALPAAR